MSSPDNSFDYLPYFTEGKVARGFGRGGAELGIPTANFPEDVIHKLPEEFVCGVYYGWACINTLSPTVYKMVMCCGWNSHFHNTMKTMETHIMHKFDHQFYDENLRIVVLGYLRPMEAYDSLDALIQAMNRDIHNAETALDQPVMSAFRNHPFLVQEIITSTSIKTSETCLSTCENSDKNPGQVVNGCPSSSPSSSPRPIGNGRETTVDLKIGEKEETMCCQTCHCHQYHDHLHRGSYTFNDGSKTTWSSSSSALIEDSALDVTSKRCSCECCPSGCDKCKTSLNDINSTTTSSNNNNDVHIKRAIKFRDQQQQQQQQYSNGIVVRKE